MKLFEVRDIVREHVGRNRLTTPVLAWCIERALREIEKTDNFYWMEATKSFSLVINQASYSIYTSTSSGLNIPNYKDARVLFMSDSSESDPIWSVLAGPEQIEIVRPAFTDADDGIPVVWTIAETNTDLSLLVWPPKPDKAYAMVLHYYNWTTLPTSVVASTHEVLLRWPEALIYAATEQAMIIANKDLQAGMFWRKMYEAEAVKIKRYHDDRVQPDFLVLTPRTGTIDITNRQWRTQTQWV